MPGQRIGGAKMSVEGSTYPVGAASNTWRLASLRRGSGGRVYPPTIASTMFSPFHRTPAERHRLGGTARLIRETRCALPLSSLPSSSPPR